MAKGSATIDITALKVAGEPNKYITKISSGDGITIHDSQNIEVNYAVINSEGMEIYQGETTVNSISVAKFGSIIRIGQELNNYIYIKNNGIYLKDKTFSIFQVEAIPLDNPFAVENIRFNRTNITNPPNSYTVTFDDMKLSNGDRINLTINYYYSVDLSASETGAGAPTHLVGEDVINQNFSYGTASTYTETSHIFIVNTVYYDLCTIVYDGKNSFNIISATNEDDSNRIQNYELVKVTVSQSLSALPITTIGLQELSHVQIDYHSLQMIDKEGDTYFYISDLRDQSGVATIHLPFEVTYAMYDNNDFVSCDMSTNVEIIDIVDEDGVSLLNSEASARYDVNNKGFYISFRNNSYEDDICTIIFTTTSVLAKAFTIGNRNTSGGIGGYSITAGYNCISSKTYSFAEGYETISQGVATHTEGWKTEANARGCHAEGYITKAHGGYSHAEGYMTTATGVGSHAEGQNTIASGQGSHAEGTKVDTYSVTATGHGAHAEGGGTTALGYASHAEGYMTTATGNWSHASGYHTIAAGEGETVIGKYNEESIQGKAFVVGNGNYTTPSNALTVDWDGNVNASGQYENLYKITTVQKVISGGINANSYEAAANITIPANTRPTGYNAVGIVGHASNYFRVQPTTNYVIDNTKIYAGFANWSATNVTADVTVTFYVLWLKATAAS